MEQQLTLDEFCAILGVLPDNALVKQVWDALEQNKCRIVKESSNALIKKPILQFKDYTTKNEHNLTGYAAYLTTKTNKDGTEGQR